MISEDVKNMGLGTEDNKGELDKKNLMGQESGEPKEMNNSDGHSQQWHNREIDVEVRTEEDSVSEYEEAFPESTKFGKSYINLNKKEQGFGSLGKIQDKRNGGKDKDKAIRKVIAENKVEMLLLQETKMKEEEIGEREVGRIWHKDEFRFLVASSEGKSGGLLTIWDTSKFRMQQCIVNTRYIIISGCWLEDNLMSKWINIYGYCTVSEQRRLWEELIVLKSGWPQPLIIGGFNMVRCKLERRRYI
ncbi:hypothetical protein V6N12_051656 [Hibiscus sabdariffa]|uniref:Uncharacterized protein n=1 Tax=Hibiscus sabdariffa TaxID=183260 RepID=A0ABR2GH05_9ROSI